MHAPRIIFKSKKAVALILALALLAGIAFLEYVTDVEIGSSILYLVAVGVAAWLGGRNWGICIAVVSALAWFVVDQLKTGQYSHVWIQYWNAFVRLGFFLVVTLLLSGIKELTARLDGMVRRQTSALESETAFRQRLEQQLLKVSELERERLGQDLHDEVAQDLVGVAFALKSLERRLTEKSLPEANRAHEIGDLVDHTLTGIRNLASTLYPVTLESEGLRRALEELCASLSDFFGVDCQFDCPEPVTITDPTMALHLYRITQEAVNNAIKHGQAKQIKIGLRNMNGKLRLTISDNGQGITQPMPQRHGMGLHIMNSRSRLLGATLHIDRQPEGGTLVAVEFESRSGAKAA